MLNIDKFDEHIAELHIYILDIATIVGLKPLLPSCRLTAADPVEVTFGTDEYMQSHARLIDQLVIDRTVINIRGI